MTVAVALAIVVLVSLHSGQADQEGDGTTLREIAQTCQTTHQAIQSLLAATGQNQTPPPTNYALPICLQGQLSDRTQKGEKGDGGEIGRVGKAGPQGPKGAKGDDGAVGIQGRKGEKGDTGPTGAKGNQGICKESTPGIPHPDFQSSWLNLHSQAGASSFMTVHHNLGELPVRVKVLVRALGGPNDGYMFEGVGATSADDDYAATKYGGVAFSYNKDEVRIWAPDVSNGVENGCIISTGGPLWGGKYDQCTHTAEVKVQAWLPLTFPCPDIETSWFEFRSQDGVNSFKEVEHNLGDRPSLVVVQYKAIDAGSDFEGFVYEGIGAAQCDDDREWANHGGLVYATDSWSVRLWAPSRHDSSYADANYGGSIVKGP
ncbi:uncharacterized protein [Ptychodera flava]|uniref:uncharacterized protein n=1 Tax=Ptychodera flava TaxID=63121 RepID=UPI00396A1627